MFVYTVYPRTPSTGKKASRRVEPVSRVKSVRALERVRTVQYDDTIPREILGPHEAVYGHHGADEKAVAHSVYRDDLKWNVLERPAGESYIQDMFPDILPLLMAWRRPETSIGADFIQERLEGLRTIRSKRGRHVRI